MQNFVEHLLLGVLVLEGAAQHLRLKIVAPAGGLLDATLFLKKTGLVVVAAVIIILVVVVVV